MNDSIFENQKKIQQRIQKAFEATETPSSVAYDISFHMTDWLSDIKDLLNIYSNIENLSDDEIQVFVYKFVAHVPNHLNAAMKLSGMGSVRDVFKVNLFEDDDE
ncbi:MAG TPA: hypothetical protein VF556_11855 [Pyrinomonadaceae bacterium]